MAIYNTLNGSQLQSFYSVEIKSETVNGVTSKYVYLHSTIHKNMPKKLTFCFSTEFSDYKILHDHNVINAMVNSFGAVTRCQCNYHC